MTSDIGRRTSDRENIVACATATGGQHALIRLSGPRAFALAAAVGLPLAAPWTMAHGDWQLAGGRCPCRVLCAAGPRSFTGFDLVEITLPGSADVVALGITTLLNAGAEAAMPGAFTRQALANGRLTLDRAEAILAVAQASDATAARHAIDRLRGAVSDDLLAVRTRLIDARAVVEAGLDFAEEADVKSYDPARLRVLLSELRTVLARWRVAADTSDGDPIVCLVGPANAGKSALFNYLTGADALVSPIAGTTRDWLDAPWLVAGRRVRLIDTAGWLDSANGLDAVGIAAGQRTVASASVVLACSAPDARLPLDAPLPSGAFVIATKADVISAPDPRAVLALSLTTGVGIDQLSGFVASRLSGIGAGEPRQQRLLADTDAVLARLMARLPSDELLAEDLRRAGDLLGDVLGVTTTDDVLAAIFSRFCIGK